MSQNLLGSMNFVGQDGLTNGGGGPGGFSLNLASASQEAMKRTSAEAGLGPVGLDRDSDSDSDGSSLPRELVQSPVGGNGKPPGKKTKGRVKIKMEFIENKLRRYTTFSKRKTGIMKKAYELSTLTGTQVMLLVASETGHVYTFATRKLQPMITSESGKALIQTCLNSPDPPTTTTTTQSIDQRMNPTGFEETDLSYAVIDEDGSSMEQTASTAKPVFPTANSTPPLNSHHLLDSPVPSPSPQSSTATSQLAVTSQSNQTISMTAYLPPANSSNSGQSKASNISMQLPTGGIILPSGGLPPGTPITLNALQQAALQQSGGQQTIYRIPTGNGQMLAIPGVTGVTSTTNSSSTSTSTSSSNSSSTTNNSNNSNQSSSGSVPTVQNVTVMTGSGLQQPSSGAPPAGTVVYQTPQGMVYASPSTATVNALPEGYILSLPQTPTFSVTGEQQGGQQQFITIPVSLANSQMLQPVLAQAGDASELLRSLEKRGK